MTGSTPATFTAADYRARMERAARSAADAGLAGLLVAPGPDMVWLTGYTPTAVTERLTLLVLTPGQDPVLVVPTLEAPDAEHATGASALTLRDWTDGTDPYAVTAGLLDGHGRFGISDNTWAMHLLGLQRALPDTSYAALTDALPMLRAVKDAAELELLAAAGAAADATFEEIRKVPFMRPPRVRRRPRPRQACCAASATSRSTSPSSAPAPTEPTRTTRSATGSSGAATWSSWTSAA